MAITVDQKYVQGVGSAGAESDGIQLPYVAPLAWWTNKRSNNKDDGVDYFGGWAMKLDDYDAGVREYGVLPNWYDDGDGGNIGQLKTCRSVLVAPFGARKRWMDKEKGDRKTGTHLLQLAYIAYIDNDRKVIPWGPMILSMKSTTAMAYDKLVAEWAGSTYAARQEFAGGAPPHFFFMPLGTFGKEPVLTEVGKAPNTSKVTHPQVFQYGEFGEKQIDYLYVGNQVAGYMAEFKAQSLDWLSDKKWKSSESLEEDESATHAAALDTISPADQVFRPEPPELFPEGLDFNH